MPDTEVQRTENRKEYSSPRIGSPSFERSRQIKSTSGNQAFQPARVEGIAMLLQHVTEDALNETDE